MSWAAVGADGDEGEDGAGHLMGDVVPLLLEKAAPKQELNIGHLTAPMVIEGLTMSRDIYSRKMA